LWLREDGTPYYVGKGSNGRAYEKHEHNGMLTPKNTECIIIQNFESEEDAFFAEKLLISFYGRIDLGTGCLRNHTDGGDGVSNPSLQTREKIRAAFVGKKRSPETIEKMRIARIGRTLSPEHRAKIGLRSLGRKYSGRKSTPETRAKISAGNKGRLCSPETREKLSIAHKGHKMGPLSPEHKAKLSAIHKGKPKSPEHRAKIGATKIGNKYGLGHIVSLEARAKISTACKAFWQKKRQVTAEVLCD